MAQLQISSPIQPDQPFCLPERPDQPFCLPERLPEIAAELQKHCRVFDLQFNITRSGEWSIVATIFTGSLEPIVVWDGQSDSLEVTILFRADEVFCSLGDRSFKFKSVHHLLLTTLMQAQQTPQIQLVS